MNCRIPDKQISDLGRFDCNKKYDGLPHNIFLEPNNMYLVLPKIMNHFVIISAFVLVEQDNR